MLGRLPCWRPFVPSTSKFQRLAVSTHHPPGASPPHERAPLEDAGQVERLDNYYPGGYHPVNIGDVYWRRYRIIHKLGHTSQSTTWLARDEKWQTHVALRIGISDHEHKEALILRSIRARAAIGIKFRHIPILPVLNQFHIRGPNGEHPCFVTKLASFSLADAAPAIHRQPLRIRVARHLAAHLAKAVAYTHRSGYMHSDLHTGNILIRPLKFERISTEEFNGQFVLAHPEPFAQVQTGQPLPTFPQHLPSKLYRPVQLGRPTNRLRLGETKPFLTGFEAAFCPENESRYGSDLPLHIRPPEVRFEPTKPLSYASDIWSLACVIWELLGTGPLFDPELTEPDDITTDQIDALGMLPGEWWEGWQAKSNQFLANGIPTAERKVFTLSKRLQRTIQKPREQLRMRAMSHREVLALSDMLSAMLMFKPEDRLTADKVLKSSWMREWAIPNVKLTSGRRLSTLQKPTGVQRQSRRDA